MISSALLERLACPVCLEPTGCAACGATELGHAACAAHHYDTRVRCSCGGPDKARLVPGKGSLDCPCCGGAYPTHEAEGYVDLVPRAAVGELTHYADHEFQERLRVTDGPPVLSARVKIDMMRRMLDPGPGETVLDLGCGAGKLALFAGRDGTRAAGLDVAPFFLPRAAREVDLVLGDLRRLPFRKGAFPRAYSLDVLEHLDENGVREVLVEARRTVGAAGRLFVYTHAMESSRLAAFQRGVNRLAKRLGRAGLIDHEREAMRKSDHRNAIRSHEHFDTLCAEAGLEVSQRRYYNVVFKAVIEDLVLRLFEQARRRPGTKEVAHTHAGHTHAGLDHEAPSRGDRARIGATAPAPVFGSAGAPAATIAPVAASAATIAPVAAASRVVLGVALALTWLLKLDVVLFGGIRTGPFFGLLRPSPVARSAGGR